MPQVTPFSVRLYNADNSVYRLLPPGQVGDDITWRIVAQGGYEQGTLLLYGTAGEFPDLVRGRRVELYYRYELPAGNGETDLLLYRGYVRRRRPARELIKGEPVRTFRVTLHGVWSKAIKGEAQKRYAIESGQDRAWFFGDLVSLYVQNRIPDLAVDPQEVGDTLQYLDVYKVPLSQAIENLAQNVGRVVYGGDVGTVVEGSKDRLYFRPVDDVSLVKHTLIVPGTHVGVRAFEEDTTNQATRLRIRGGLLRYPNLAADCVEGNTSFENPILPDGSNSNLLVNPSFELGSAGFAAGWDKDGTGPFWTDGGTGYGSADTGSKIIVLDDLNDRVKQIPTSLSPAPTVGATYAFNVRAHQSGTPVITPSEMEVTLSWLDSGGGVLDTVTLPFIPADFVRFEDHRVFLAVPPSTAKYEVKVELSDDNGPSIVIDSLSLYNASVVMQPGWSMAAHGTGVINYKDWAYSGRSRSGAYSLYADVTASGYGNNVVLAPKHLARRPYEGGMPVRLKFWRHSPLEGGAYPDMTSQLLFYKEGKLIDFAGVATFAGGAGPLTDWQNCPNEYTGPSDADEVSFVISLDSTGKALIDDVSLEHQAADADAWYEADRYEKVFLATDLFSPGDPIYDEAAAIEASEGGIEVTEERDEINNDVDGETYARSAFAQLTLPLQRPDMETFGVVETGAGLTTAEMWPGQNVRVIGQEADDLLPDGPLPIAEIEGKWDGTKLTLKPFLQSEKQDRARTIRDLIKKTAGSGGASGSAGSIGGSFGTAVGTGSGGGAPAITIPLPVAQGGTEADNASDARDNLGLGTIAVENAGVSIVVTLAKITGGGLDGSLTFTNGILTAATAPT